MRSKIITLLLVALFCLATLLVLGVNHHQLFVLLVLVIGLSNALILWYLGADGHQFLKNVNSFNQEIGLADSKKNEIEKFRQLETLLKEQQNRISQMDSRLNYDSGQYQRLQESFRELEERYNFMLGRSNDGSWEWDLKTNAMNISPNWKVMLGYNEEYSIENADAFKALVDATDLPRVEQRLKGLIEGKTQHFQDEHRLICKNGNLLWVLTRSIAIRHASGKPYKIIGHCSNINSVKRMEEILAYLAEGTTGLSGEKFFKSLVKNFALALDVKVAFITECVNRPPTRVRALAFWTNGQFIEDEYDLANTPCEKVIQEGASCFIPDRLGEDFPGEFTNGYCSYLGIPIFDSQQNVLGHLCFEDDKVMNESILINSIYRIFVARAADEMERMQKDKLLAKI